MKAESRSGSYSTRISLTDPLTGKRSQRRVTARTKRELDAAVSTLKASWHGGTYVEPTTQTLGDYLESWLSTLTRSSATQHQYGVRLRTHVLSDDIATIPLGRLRRAHIQQFLDGMTADGYAPNTVRSVHAVLSSALHRALRVGTIANNPATGVELPPLRRGRPSVWSTEHARQFLTSVADEPDAAFWVLATTLGVRRGELLGLRWEDIDLTAGTLTVRRTQTRTRDGVWIIGDATKTASGTRTMQLPAITRDALRRQRTEQLERRLRCGDGWQDTDAVFDRGDGCHWPNPEVLGRRFHRLTDNAGLPRIKLHGLRHTAATNMLRQGIPVHVVSQILGHANPSVTLNVYAWVLADMQASAADQIDALYA